MPIGAPVELVHDLWMIPMPSLVSYGQQTNCVVAIDADGGAHLFDPGWDGDENWALLAGALESIGSGKARIRSVSVTHLHRDHLGLAGRIRAETGATVGLGVAEQEAIDLAEPSLSQKALTRWAVPAAAGEELAGLFPSRRIPAFTADRWWVDGDSLPIAGWTVTAIATPGHTTGHVCFRIEEAGLVLTGDHVLPHMNPGLGLGGEDLGDTVADYLDSLRRTPIEPRALPGHGQIIEDLPGRCDAIDRHQRDRYREVADVVAHGAVSSVWDVASRIGWSQSWSDMRPTTRAAALAQTELHLRHLTIAG